MSTGERHDGSVTTGPSRRVKEEAVLIINVLGEMEVHVGALPCTPSAPKPRRVLALLALNANQVVRTGSLMEELWEESPPPSANTTLQTYIYYLRKLLSGAGLGGSIKDVLRTTPAGYVLALDKRRCDYARFEDDVRRGRSAYHQGDLESAAALLESAMALWRGPALGDLARGPLLEAYATRLEEQRTDALQLWIEVNLALGRYRELIGELKALTTRHRLDEWFHGKLMLVLHRSGRRSEALGVYHTIRGTLIGELGLEPSAELQMLQREVMAGTAG